MSATWVNVYTLDGAEYKCEFMPEGTPEEAQRYSLMAQNAPSFIRVEMRINGHWHRPPVGIRAEQCSHEWRERYDDNACVFEEYLGRRR